MDRINDGRIPTLHVTGDSIPQAYFRAIKAVWENGYAMRTEYDRKTARAITSTRRAVTRACLSK